MKKNSFIQTDSCKQWYRIARYLTIHLLSIEGTIFGGCVRIVSLLLVNPLKQKINEYITYEIIRYKDALNYFNFFKIDRWKRRLQKIVCTVVLTKYNLIRSVTITDTQPCAERFSFSTSTIDTPSETCSWSDSAAYLGLEVWGWMYRLNFPGMSANPTSFLAERFQAIGVPD